MADETQWYILDEEDRQRGPFDAPQVLSMVADGQIAPESFCWREGMDAWTPLAEVDLFAITLVLSVASRRHLRALPAPRAAASPRKQDQPKPTPAPTQPRQAPPPSRSTRTWLGTCVVLLLSAGAGVGLWWYKPWTRGQAERRKPSAETAPARTAAPSAGTADALGRAVFNCLVSGDEPAFAKTFMDPDTMRAYLKDQARRSGRFRRGDFDRMALAAFEEGYSYNRQQYLDAFRAARKRGRDDGVDWGRAEIKDVKVYFARADVSGRTAERVRIRFQSPAGWHSVAIGSCVQTPMGWRVKVTTLVGPRAIAPAEAAAPPSPPPPAPLPTVVAWVKEDPPAPPTPARFKPPVGPRRQPASRPASVSPPSEPAPPPVEPPPKPPDPPVEPPPDPPAGNGAPSWDVPGWTDAAHLRSDHPIQSRCTVLKRIPVGKKSALAGVTFGPPVQRKTDAAYQQFKEDHFQAFEAAADKDKSIKKPYRSPHKIGDLEYDRITILRRFKGATVMVTIRDGRCVAYWFLGDSVCFKPFIAALSEARPE